VRVIWGLQNIVEPFVVQVAEMPRGFGPCVTAAIVNADNEFIAGVVFHNYSPEGGVIEASAASIDARWATRSVLSELMAYVFPRCQMLVARASPDNKRVMRLWKALGAQEYIIPRLRGRTASEAILCVTDDAWAKSKLNEATNGQT